jgi:lipid II:glycine glycyltransferase (peptidoglycan interpeptide bridge formation enzyme)
MSTLYEFIKEKSNKTLDYYEDLYKVFNKDEMIDLILLEIDYYKYLGIYKKKYEELTIENEKINYQFSRNPLSNDLYTEKVKSDKKISELEEKINLVTQRLKTGAKKEIIGGALIIKDKNTSKINLVISGIDSKFPNLNYKYFLYYSIANYYKKLNYSFFDLNGISGNFTENNPYKKLNDFKLSFNPDVYEYIGEFDLVINNRYYNILWNSGKLKKEFIH